MKSLSRTTGKRGYHMKYNVQLSPAKYWGTLGRRSRPFRRDDGSIGVDKTRGWHSRPVYKERLRNANRAITKRARQVLKRQMLQACAD